MSEKKAQHEESGEKVPIWVISFADMITLLLSFFVMLQTMAHSRSPELFQVGQGSFKRAIAGLGIPDLLFGKPPAGKDYHRIKYPTEEAPQPQPNPPRIIDADGDAIRKMFGDLQKLLEVETADEEDRLIDVRVTPIRFSHRTADLDEPSRKYLRDLALDLIGNLPRQSLKIYVTSTAEDAAGSKQQCLLAARRSAAVVDQLREQLSARGNRCEWEFYPLGNDSGKPAAALAAAPSRPAVTITVLGPRSAAVAASR